MSDAEIRLAEDCVMPGRLLHYSAARFVGPVFATVDQLKTDMKPTGLWVSVEGDNDWKSWCDGERFGADRMTHVSEIVPHPDANILRLGSAADIDAFHADYTAPFPGLPPGMMAGYAIDWRRVGEQYDGIVIAPYVWARRLDGRARWYYGWDCASGCLWHPRAIAEIYG